MPAPSTRLLQKILVVFYRLLYHEFAWAYDAVAWLVSVGQWQQWVASALPHIKEGRVLELGHGPGHLQVLGYQSQLDMFGLDLSPHMGRISRSKFLRKGYPTKLIRGSGTTIPIADNTISTVVATFPSEYIIKPETLNNILRVLVPGGRFVLVPLAWITGPGMFHRLAAWLFKITGQSVSLDHPLLEHGRRQIVNAGFSTETHINSLKHSKVLILVAEKDNRDE